MKTEILTLGNQLVAAAANGIYQGIIVTALVALSLRVPGRTNAATRHAVWFCTLLLLVSLLVAHCLIGPPRSSETKDVATVPIPGLEAVPSGSTVAQDMAAGAGMNSITSAAFGNDLTPDAEPPLEPKPGSQALWSIEVMASEAPLDPGGNLFPPPAMPTGNERGNVASVREPLAVANVAGETTRLRWPAERLVNPVSLNLTLGHKVPRIASLMLLAFWLAMAGVRIFVLVLQLYRIQELKRCSCPPGTGLNELFQQLTTRLGVKRNVELKVSPAHRSSFLLGFLHPVILLPAEERLESGEAELVLRHELAHVRRRDDWANLVQHFILAAFFFHPAVWWVSKKLTLEREIACDDHVLQQNARPQAYALLLANLAARLQRGLPLLAPGSSNNKTQLKQRIDMILNTHRNTSPRLAKTWLAVITSAAALLAVATICSAPRIVLAQNETAPAAAHAPSDKFVKAMPLAQPNAAGARINTNDASQLAELGAYTTHVVQTKYMKPAELVPVLTPFASMATAVLPIDASGILVLRDHTENVKRMLETVEKVDVIADAPAGGIALATFAPDAPDSDSADTVSRATPAPAAVNPSPKFKPGNPSALNPRPAVKAVPGIPPAPVAPSAVVAASVPPAPVFAAIKPVPEPPVAGLPRPVRTPRPGNKDSSLEDRLERLERMVESLLKQQNFHLKSANDGLIDRKETAKIEAFARRQAEVPRKPMLGDLPLGVAGSRRQAEVSRKQMIEPKEIEKIKDQAEREAARAVDQAKRATAEVEKAVKAEQKRPTSRKIKEGSQKQLEALRKQLEMLEREREKLDRQIEQLEQDREQLDEQGDEDQAGGDTRPDESKAECVTLPSVPR